MLIEKAREIVHTYYKLVGHESETFKDRVMVITISFKEDNLRKADLQYYHLPGMRLPVLPKDGDAFDIYAVFEGGGVVQVDILIKADNIPLSPQISE